MKRKLKTIDLKTGKMTEDDLKNNIRDYVSSVKEGKPKDKEYKIGDFEEDWEDIEETPEYTFLKTIYEYVNKRSYPRKSTRKFLRMVFDLIDKGDMSRKSLDDFVDNEGIDKKLVQDAEKKSIKVKTKHTSGGGYSSSC